MASSASAASASASSVPTIKLLEFSMENMVALQKQNSELIAALTYSRKTKDSDTFSVGTTSTKAGAKKRSTRDSVDIRLIGIILQALGIEKITKKGKVESNTSSRIKAIFGEGCLFQSTIHGGKVVGFELLKPVSSFDEIFSLAPTEAKLNSLVSRFVNKLKVKAPSQPYSNENKVPNHIVIGIINSIKTHILATLNHEVL